MEIKYPEIEVQLSGEDGNGFFIVGRVSMALREGGVPWETIEEYQDEATSGDYEHLLQVTMRWVAVL